MGQVGRLGQYSLSMKKRISPLLAFLNRESSAGGLLLFSATVGLLVANSPLGDTYFEVLKSGLELSVGEFYLKLTVMKFINYVMMTLFFFVVGLEIKRELTSGHLATIRSAVMPLLGALGGMAIPALIYLLIAGSGAPRGWGVAVATDIALAVGLLSLIGKSVAPSLRIFLLGLAVIDDIGAILIIAFIYSSGIEFLWTFSSIVVTLLIYSLRKGGVDKISIYVIFGVILWYSLYRSGIHPTLAGVILGLLTPNIKYLRKSDIKDDGNESLIEMLERRIHPISTYLIVPIFAFANTGVRISQETISSALSSSLVWGIFLGLVIGKPLGVVTSVILAHKANIGDLPARATKIALLGTGSAAGIGFTVAIFIADLAFPVTAENELAVLAVIAASISSAFLSWYIFRFTRKS